MIPFADYSKATKELTRNLMSKILSKLASRLPATDFTSTINLTYHCIIDNRVMNTETRFMISNNAIVVQHSKLPVDPFLVQRDYLILLADPRAFDKVVDIICSEFRQ